MKCNNCGEQIPDNSSYCPSCGSYIAPVDQAQPSPEENAVPAGEAASADIPANPETAAQPPVDFESGYPLPEQAPEQADLPPVYGTQQSNPQTELNQNHPYNTAAANMPYDIQNAKKRSYVWVAVAAIAVALIAAGIILVYNMMFAGANTLFRILDKSQAAYTEELNALMDNNPVLSQINALAEDSFTLTTEVSQVIFKVNHDLDANILDFELQYPMTYLMSSNDLDARLYLTDSSVILGAENVLYAESSYDELGEQLSAFSIKNGLDLDQEMIDALAESAAAYQENGTQQASYAEYYDLVKSFLSAVEFLETSDFVTIGDEQQTCDRYELTYTQSDLVDWIENELIPWVQAHDDAVTAYLMVLSESEDKDELIEELESAADSISENNSQFTLSFMVYDDVIVGIALENSSGNIFSLSATGGDYRLNHITFAFYDGYDDCYLELTGNHIGSAYVETELAFFDGYSEESYGLIWDTEKQFDNFTYTDHYYEESYTFTLTANDGGVMLTYDDFMSYYEDLSLNIWLAPLETSLQVPESTIPLSEMDLEDFYASFSGDAGGMMID